MVVGVTYKRMKVEEVNYKYTLVVEVTYIDTWGALRVSEVVVIYIDMQTVEVSYRCTSAGLVTCNDIVDVLHVLEVAVTCNGITTRKTT